MINGLTDKVVVVVDGTTFIGIHIVECFLKGGATVVVPANSSKDILYLRCALLHVNQEKLVTFLTDLMEYGNMKNYTEILCQQFGHIDLGVVYFPVKAGRNSFVNADLSDWQLFHNSLQGYYVASRILWEYINGSDGMVITISNLEDGRFKHAPALQRLSSICQTEIAGFIAAEKERLQSRYHHISISSDVEAAYADARLQTGDAGDIAKQVVALYLNNKPEYDKTFHTCFV